MANNIQIGQHVTVRCHVYKKGRKFKGVVIQTFPLLGQSKVRLDGNKKSTIFCDLWITPCTK